MRGERDSEGRIAAITLSDLDHGSSLFDFPLTAREAQLVRRLDLAFRFADQTLAALEDADG